MTNLPEDFSVNFKFSRRRDAFGKTQVYSSANFDGDEHEIAGFAGETNSRKVIKDILLFQVKHLLLEWEKGEQYD